MLAKDSVAQQECKTKLTRIEQEERGGSIAVISQVFLRVLLVSAWVLSRLLVDVIRSRPILLLFADCEGLCRKHG